MMTTGAYRDHAAERIRAALASATADRPPMGTREPDTTRLGVTAPEWAHRMHTAVLDTVNRIRREQAFLPADREDIADIDESCCWQHDYDALMVARLTELAMGENP